MTEIRMTDFPTFASEEIWLRYSTPTGNLLSHKVGTQQVELRLPETIALNELPTLLQAVTEFSSFVENYYRNLQK